MLPEAIRLVLLRVRVPRYQRDMLVALAQRHGVSVDEIVTREMEDVACAHAEELADVVPSLAIGLGAGMEGGAVGSRASIPERARLPGGGGGGAGEVDAHD